jgi:predicted esterase
MTSRRRPTIRMIASLPAAPCLVAALMLACASPLRAAAQDIPRGQIVDDVKCAGDPAQGYALYVPSSYAPGRGWSLLMGFHPAARGRAIVEKYRAAAEAYGYIVAVSNNSRNGAWDVSAQAVVAMSADLTRRFAIDPARVYLTGMSGGARVAMQVALRKNRIAGVIASSAGYPDAQPRASVPFAVFGTAGTDDFNYSEMRQLDRALKTPHRLVVFEGGHTLPPDAVAMDAVEWMELQAMASGLRPRDEALVARLFEKREQAIASAGPSAAAVHLLRGLAEDFKGLRDVSAATARADALAKQKDVKTALARERADDDAEMRLVNEIATLEAGLSSDEQAVDSLSQLRDLLARLWKQATSEADSTERSRARRVLRVITMGASERVQHPAYLKMLQQYRLPGTGRGGGAASALLRRTPADGKTPTRVLG